MLRITQACTLLNAVLDYRAGNGAAVDLFGLGRLSDAKFIDVTICLTRSLITQASLNGRLPFPRAFNVPAAFRFKGALSSWSRVSLKCSTGQGSNFDTKAFKWIAPVAAVGLGLLNAPTGLAFAAAFIYPFRKCEEMDMRLQEQPDSAAWCGAVYDESIEDVEVAIDASGSQAAAYNCNELRQQKRQRSHHQRQRAKAFRNRVQIPTPEMSD